MSWQRAFCGQVPTGSSLAERHGQFASSEPKIVSASARFERASSCRSQRPAHGHCGLRTVFPQAISGLRKPIAAQAAISFNMNLPE